MVISIDTLPSKGYTSMVREINLTPLTYQQIINYNKRLPDNPLDKAIHDIEGLLSDIPGYESLSAYDLKMLIFTRKWISATFEPKIKIPIGGTIYEVALSDISFKDIDKTNLLEVESVSLRSGTYMFAVPAIGQLLRVLRYLVSNSIYCDLETAMLIAALDTANDTSRTAWVVNNASQEEIPQLRLLANQLCNNLEDVTIPISQLPTATSGIYRDTVEVEGIRKEVAVVDINENITDTFRFIEINCPINSTSIIHKKKVGNRHY